MRRATEPSTPPAPSALSPSGPYRAMKVTGLVVLCAAWVVLGLVGHDPWKTEDATSFGVAWDIVHNGNWLAPSLTGEPYVDHPPLVYALAALLVKLFGTVLAPHDAARLAVGVFLGATLLLLAAAAQELNGRSQRWLPVLLFIGSIGLWDRAHQLSAELGVLTGIALAQYGFALALRRAAVGGIALGLGVALGFLAHGLLGPVWIAVTALALPAAFRNWRTRSHAVTLAVALAVAVPLCAGWMLLQDALAPVQWRTWRESQSFAAYFAPLTNLGGDLLYLAKNVPWFTWPALPLVLWTLWIRRRGFNGGLAVPGVQLPGMLAAILLVGVTVMKDDPRLALVMPLLLPLALLAALEVDTLPRGFSGALDWFGILTFGLLGALVWWLWIDAWQNGTSPQVARLLRDTEIGYRPSAEALALCISVVFTLAWLALVRPARRSNRRAVLNWAVGATLVWTLYMTIWLPYLDSRRSYRSVAESMAVFLPAKGCVASRHLGEPQRALFRYFASLATVREETNPEHGCAALLVQHGRGEAPVPAPRGWVVAWEGNRRGDDTERFVLYRKVPQ